MTISQEAVLLLESFLMILTPLYDELVREFGNPTDNTEIYLFEPWNLVYGEPLMSKEDDDAC